MYVMMRYVGNITGWKDGCIIIIIIIIIMQMSMTIDFTA